MTLIEDGLQPRSTYRAGQIKGGDKNEKGEPRRTDGFRFTTYSHAAAEQVADLYHGYQLRPWGQQWEVYTRERELDVALPPGKLVISQAMMRWSGGGPTMVCNGKRTSKPVAGGPCQCPKPENPNDEESVWRAVAERLKLAGYKVPQGCRPHTWVNVALPDIDGFGVWTALSKSERAASEIVQQARLMEAYRAAGKFCPAKLALEYHETPVDGLLRKYNVLAIRIEKSLRTAAAELGSSELAAQLPPAPRERIAITAGPAAPAPIEPAPIESGSARSASPPPSEGLRTAQQTADIARSAANRDVLRILIKDIVARRMEHAEVLVNGIPWDLKEYLTLRWDEFAGAPEDEPPGGAA